MDFLEVHQVRRQADHFLGDVAAKPAKIDTSRIRSLRSILTSCSLRIVLTLSNSRSRKLVTTCGIKVPDHLEMAGDRIAMGEQLLPPSPLPSSLRHRLQAIEPPLAAPSR